MIGNRNQALAAVVASLFAFGAGQAVAEDHAPAGEKIECEGVNSCKGHGSCKSAKNACAGKNGCAGQGFEMLTAEECDAAKAKMQKEKN